MVPKRQPRGEARKLDAEWTESITPAVHCGPQTRWTLAMATFSAVGGERSLEGAAWQSWGAPHVSAAVPHFQLRRETSLLCLKAARAESKRDAALRQKAVPRFPSNFQKMDFPIEPGQTRISTVVFRASTSAVICETRLGTPTMIG